MNKKEIYLDNAATTPVSGSVRRQVNRVMQMAGNPSSYNDAGRRVADELFAARQTIARFLGAQPGEIVFTGSGTEANNLAVFGSVGRANQGAHIITTAIEHPSVLEPVKRLAVKGHPIHFLKVNHEGTIDIQELEAVLEKGTVLVSVMYANNEVGTIQPVAKIGKLIADFRKKNRSRFPLFHIDACQAAGALNMNVNHLGADLVTFNGSKIYGPRGAGVLYVRQGVFLEPQILGGDQEGGLRAGTENVAAIAGLATAVKEIDHSETRRLGVLRDYFFNKLSALLAEARINGAVGDQRLANNINISIPGLQSEVLLLELDKHGIRAGSGSACTARSVEPSHVLQAMGVLFPYLDGALRFTLGRSTKKSDIDTVLRVLPRIVAVLQKRYRSIAK